MLFPDYYFFAKRRLENYTIETRKAKNLDDCELMCYLNDNCVSLNFKKLSDNNEQVHICELNNATHLKYDSDLTTDANFYYRGSKVSYKMMFRNCRLGMIQKELWMFMQIFVYSIIRYLVSSFIQSLHLSFVISFCFIFSPSERL